MIVDRNFSLFVRLKRTLTELLIPIAVLRKVVMSGILLTASLAPKALALDSLATSADRPFHILLDPGHGGVDTGAIRPGLKESEIALKVSLLLAALLKDDKRFQVSLTRERDQTVSLEQRASRAKEEKPDLFLSIHLNSSADQRAQGKEFYFQNQLPVDEESMFLASRENTDNNGESFLPPAAQKAKRSEQISAKADLRKILEDLNHNEQVQQSSELSQILFETWMASKKGRKSGSRAIRQAPFYVVSNVPAPSVLVELGFITHPIEGPRLGTKAYQNELAQSLYSGIAKFKETVDKDRKENLKSADAL